MLKYVDLALIVLQKKKKEKLTVTQHMPSNTQSQMQNQFISWPIYSSCLLASDKVLNKRL